jgi:hypothetical protein
MVAVGDRIDLRELQARWAYAELASSRVGHHYRREFPENRVLFEKVSNGELYDTVLPGEVDQLVIMNEWYRSGLVQPLQQYSAFVCESWTKDQLGRALTVPALDPRRQGRNVPILSFAVAPHFTRSDGTMEDTDPRVIANMIPLDHEFTQTEPVPVTPLLNGQYLLLDGYLRSLLFLRSEDPDRHMLVWVPVVSG